ncbi:hypothetical protein [Xenophilus sp. Marseille-Q4582]|uniref:hypothetical protein n=1 Tax=Xenophilus sp. Marseille-Q4582 TaxID=2866600 RepID=UPI001CE3DEBE|nr:hypothetical protein [Xenophilus sp. Marseille-Q4582]
MLFALGVVILLVTHGIGAVYILRNRRSIAAHERRVGPAMYALGAGYLIGAGCVLASILTFAARWLP